METAMKRTRLRSCTVLLALTLLPATLSLAKDSDDEQRLQKASQVLGEIINIPDNIPQDLDLGLQVPFVPR
jgi:hypothetical protein